MSDEIIKILDNLCERFGIAIDWSSQNVFPYLEDLITRYVKYEISTSVFWLIIGVLLFVTALILIYVFREKDIDFKSCAYTFWIIFGAVGLIIIIAQMLDIITCCTIPEKMIFEYLDYVLGG